MTFAWLYNCNALPSSFPIHFELETSWTLNIQQLKVHLKVSVRLIMAWWWCPVAFLLQVHFSGQYSELSKTTGQHFSFRLQLYQHLQKKHVTHHILIISSEIYICFKHSPICKPSVNDLRSEKCCFVLFSMPYTWFCGKQTKFDLLNC